jgi:hypothetical protein
MLQTDILTRLLSMIEEEFDRRRRYDIMKSVGRPPFHR